MPMQNQIIDTIEVVVTQIEIDNLILKMWRTSIIWIPFWMQIIKWI